MANRNLIISAQDSLDRGKSGLGDALGGYAGAIHLLNKYAKEAGVSEAERKRIGRLMRELAAERKLLQKRSASFGLLRRQVGGLLR